MLNAEYGVRFEAIITDNGPEMASRTHHPMERMLVELGIKDTRPYGTVLAHPEHDLLEGTSL